MEIIYFWLLFVVGCIIVIAPIIIAIIQLSDDAEEGAASYLFALSVFLSGLIPVIGINIIPESTLLKSWYISIGVLIIIQIIVTIYNIRKSIHYIVSLIASLALSCGMFFCNTKLTLANTNFLPHLEFETPMVLLTFWIPLGAILIIAALVLRRKEINYVQIPYKEKDDREYFSRTSSMESVLVRRTMENLTQQVIQQHQDLLIRLQEISKNFSKLNIHKIGGAKKQNITLDRVVLDTVEKIEKDLATLSNRVSITNVKQLTITNQILVRELTHFIATPLATIETTCDLIPNSLSANSEEKLNQYITRIKSAVNICKGILQTYREIFLCSVSSEDSSLKNLINDSFEVYKGGKNVSIKIDVQDKYDGVNNYYILSTILPVLANAVRASKENSEIEVVELQGTIKISNTYLDNVEISDLETEGFSTKENHKGMGLYTVRHLLASRKAGTLKISKQDDKIVFEIPICIQDHE